MKSKCVIQNHNISAVFDLCDGISIVSIYDKINCFEFLEAPSPLFKYSINDSCFYASNSQNQFGIRGVVVTDRIVSDEGQKVMIHSKTSYNEDIEICILIYTGKNDNELILRASLINNTSRAISVKLTFPAVKNMTVPGFEIDPARMIGAVPQEIAGATPLIFCDSIGMTPPSADDHLPSSMNTMQTCGIYDRDGFVI